MPVTGHSIAPDSPSSSSWPSRYDSRTKGNVATEIVKYYLQLHYGIKKDYRLRIS